jgi:CRP-like cAMP-binding protein
MSVNLPNIHHGTGDDATVATVESSQQSTDATHDPTTTSGGRKKNGLDKLPLKQLFEIDYVGNKSFVASQRNILMKRCDEPFGINLEAKLSARGLHHRQREEFQRECKESTAIILNSIKEDKGAKKGNKPKAQLLQPYFQRALSFERLGQLDRAQIDYDKVLLIDPNHTSALYNKSNLFYETNNMDKSLEYLNQAIRLDPMNLTYRNNKARILRRQGEYMDAIQETMIHRAIETQPEFMKGEFESGHDPNVDSSGLKRKSLPKDPILVVLSLPKIERKKKYMAAVVDFISQLKFFSAFKNSPSRLDEIASHAELTTYEKGEFIFEEGMLGEHFYMILDGEVSIVKCKKKEDTGEIYKTNVLVRLFRGHTFGETALESKGGVRSAGALASQPTALLGLHVDIYSKIVGAYKAQIRAEVCLVLSNCPAFSELTPESLQQLANSALVRSFGSNKQIQTSGEKSNYLYIVKHGLIKLIKKLKKPKVNNIKVFTPYSGKVQKDETPGLWVLEKSYTTPMDNDGGLKRKGGASGPTNKGEVDPFKVEDIDPSSIDPAYALAADDTEFTVGVIASGQIFGELAVLNPGAPAPTTAISSTPCEVFCLDGETVLKLGAKYSQKCMSALTEGITLHNPPAEKLGYFFRQKYVRERQMKNIMSMLKSSTK